MNLSSRPPIQVSASSGLAPVPQSPASDHAYMNVSVTSPLYGAGGAAPGQAEAEQQRRPTNSTLTQALRLQSQTSRPFSPVGSVGVSSPDSLGGPGARGPDFSADVPTASLGLRAADTDTSHSHSPFASAASSTPSPITSTGGALPVSVASRSRNELDRQSPRCVCCTAPHCTHSRCILYYEYYIVFRRRELLYK